MAAATLVDRITTLLPDLEIAQSTGVPFIEPRSLPTALPLNMQFTSIVQYIATECDNAVAECTDLARTMYPIDQVPTIAIVTVLRHSRLWFHQGANLVRFRFIVLDQQAIVEAALGRPRSSSLDMEDDHAVRVN